MRRRDWIEIMAEDRTAPGCRQARYFNARWAVPNATGRPAAEEMSALTAPARTAGLNAVLGLEVGPWSPTSVARPKPWQCNPGEF